MFHAKKGLRCGKTQGISVEVSILYEEQLMVCGVVAE